ncbi:3-oxoacyl-ACP synthase [Pseudonocardiaceae bacterium YIM PH 21723]|nr:3-oxoacyl-ACP synthase [Pseudonocardiaceae bacterium YIM PH 21723]
MTAISLTDVAGYLPGEPVDLTYFTALPRKSSAMFAPPQRRHHIARDETAVDMIERAARSIVDRQGSRSLRGVNALLVHTQVPDQPFTGCGSEVARRLGMYPEWVLDVHNGGCASFVHMLALARRLLEPGQSALLCNVQNAAGKIYTQSEVRKRVEAPVPGDACGVGLVTTSAHSPVLEIECRNLGEFAGGMEIVTGDGSTPHHYWEPNAGQGWLGFSDSSIAKVLSRGNRLVPEVITAVCDRLGVSTAEIDTLITNQPNRLFLRNWREALQLDQERQIESFNDCGNMFGAAMPVNFERGVRDGRIKDDSLVVLGGFAHVGDFAAAAAIRWQGTGIVH